MVFAWRVRAYGNPWPGGWLDWPAGWVSRMTVLENVYNAMKSFHNAPPGQTAEWYKAHPADGELFDYVTELRVKHGFWSR